MNKIGILLVYSDKNLGDLAIVLSRIQKLKNDKKILFSVYNRFQLKFYTEHEKLLKNHAVLSNPYGELGLDFSKKILKDTSKIIHFFFLIPLYFYHKLIYRLNLKWNSFINEIKTIERFYVKGGSIFESYGSIRELVSLVRIWLFLSIANQCKKKIIIDPQSFGPFKGYFSSYFFQKILDKVDKVHCREKISYRYLKKYFRVKKLELKPDIVFHYEMPQGLTSLEREKIGITIVSSRLNQKDYLNVLFKLIEKASIYFKTKNFVIVRQVDLNKYNHSEIFIESKIIERFKGKIEFEIKKDINNIEEVLKIYKSLKFLIGSRLHSTILSYLVATPFLCIEYQGFKARGTYSLIGSEHRVFTLAKLDKELGKSGDEFNQILNHLSNTDDINMNSFEEENFN